MNANPYASPSAECAPPGHSHERLAVVIVSVITAVLTIGAILQLSAALLQFWSPLFEAIAGFLMPRFGWIGLILGGNAIYGLVLWLRKREAKGLLASAWMLLVVAIVNAGQHLYTQSVITPTGGTSNPFTSHHPSFWGYAVASYLVAAAIVFWLWWLLRPRPDTIAASDEGL